jgi:hypothetical protein
MPCTDFLHSINCGVKLLYAQITSVIILSNLQSNSTICFIALAQVSSCLLKFDHDLSRQACKKVNRDDIASLEQVKKRADECM